MLVPKKNYLLFLVLACLAVFFVHLDTLYVNIMEARNFITAREMLQDGNWLLPTLNGEPRYHKPPLPTWLTAISAGIFSLQNITALRLPAAIMGLTLVLFVYSFLVQLIRKRIFAFMCALILLTSFYIVFGSRNGQWDIFTHAFMMGCIYYLYLLFTQDTKKYQNAAVAAVFFGLSFLSKGPVSLYALLLPFVISYAIVFKFKDISKKIGALLLFLVVASVLSGWWHLYVYTTDGETLAEITRLEAANWKNYNVRPFYYYWSFFIQSGIWTIPAFISLLYPYLKNKVFHQKTYLFSLLWALIAVVLLSLIPEKKPRYLIPVLIPLAMTTGFYIEYLFRKFKEIKSKWELYPVFFNFGLIAAIGFIFPVGGYFFLKEGLEGRCIWFILLSVTLVLIGFFMLRYLFRRNIQPVFYLSITFIAAIMCFGMPLAKAVTINPEYKSLENIAVWQQKTGLTVYELGTDTPEMFWAYGKKLPLLRKTDTSKVMIPSQPAFGVLVAKEEKGTFKRTFSAYKIDSITRFDMNPKGTSSKSHQTRLYRDLFLVTKK